MYQASRCLHIACMILFMAINSAYGWWARYNYSGNGGDEAYAVAIDSAGYIYVTGSSNGDDDDYATIKYSPAGMEQWVARYSGPGFGQEIAFAIAVDNAGNIYVTGWSFGIGTDYDYATVKYDSAGVEQWVARYCGTGFDLDGAEAMTIDCAGNIVVTGRSFGAAADYDYATVKYDTAGTELWVARFDGASRLDWAHAIVADNAGNIYVTGRSRNSNGDYDYATVKYDPAGVEQWVARYNGSGNGEDCASAIAVDNSGNIYVTGWSFGIGTDEDYATIKYDSNGIEQWVTRYNHLTGALSRDYAYAIAMDNSCNIYVTGESYDSITRYDCTTVKYDSTGMQQWVARYNSPDNLSELALGIVVDDAGDVIVTGGSTDIATDYDYATIKYSPAGEERWVARYDGPASGQDIAWAIAVDDSCNVVITGGSDGGWATGDDYATVKYTPDGVGVKVNQRYNVTKDLIGATILCGPLRLPDDKRYRVFDITGRIVDPHKIAPGIYFVEIENEIVQKIVKIR